MLADIFMVKAHPRILARVLFDELGLIFVCFVVIVCGMLKTQSLALILRLDS